MVHEHTLSLLRQQRARKRRILLSCEACDALRSNPIVSARTSRQARRRALLVVMSSLQDMSSQCAAGIVARHYAMLRHRYVTLHSLPTFSQQHAHPYQHPRMCCPGSWSHT